MVRMSLTYAFCSIAMMATQFLISRWRFSLIRASSFVTILMVICTTSMTSHLTASKYSGAILGGTFIGMTDNSRMSRSFLFLACLLFSLSVHYLIPLNRGLGGVIGFFAFSSLVLIYFISKKIFSR